MTSRATTVEQRQCVNTARAYRRAGYRVSTPEKRDLPAFLDGIVPDLVAERDDDHVVIAIKRADAVAGSNDILALANKVTPQAGWRFELISVPSPDHVVVTDLSALRDECDRLLAEGFERPAFLVFFVGIENLIGYAAVREGINTTNSSSAQARTLVVRGIISSQAYDNFGRLSAVRDRIARGGKTASPSRSEIDALFALGRRLSDELLETQAA